MNEAFVRTLNRLVEKLKVGEIKRIEYRDSNDKRARYRIVKEETFSGTQIAIKTVTILGNEGESAYYTPEREEELLSTFVNWVTRHREDTERHQARLNKSRYSPNLSYQFELVGV